MNHSQSHSSDGENPPVETSPLINNNINNSSRQAACLEAQHRLPHARKLLYTTHLFAQFSDVAWQFCLILFLAAFTNYKSFMLVSTYGLISGITVCLFGSLAGRFIDSSNRLFVAQRFIWTENILVVIATMLSYMLLTRDLPESAVYHDVDNDTDEESTSWLWSRLNGVPLDPISVALLIGIHIFGSAAEILSRGFLVSIERDWIVVMSKLASRNYGSSSTTSIDQLTCHPDDDEKAWLSETNVTMKQIDLSAKVCAPAIAGFLIAAFRDSSQQDNDEHGKDLRGAAVLVGLLNVASLTVEYVCTAYIYKIIPDLAVKPKTATTTTSNNGDNKNDDRITQLLLVERESSSGCRFCKLPYGLKVYMDQSVAWGGIGFALLYLNALTFGALMTAYLVFRGMSFSTVGVWRGISSAIGLLGTIAYHFSVKYMSVESTGMWSICFQFVCLTLSYGSLYVGDNIASLVLLISGVCASRVGLWVFDISMTQLFQEYIPAPVRGVTGGVQQSLNAFFGLFAFVLGILFPDPREFHIYVAAGYASVGISMIIYTFSIYLRRDKL